jgi:hypothetical protein
MSKKKNTLKDLDEFLKQQAATLVAPTQLSEKIEEPAPVKEAAPTPVKETPAAEVTIDTILHDLQTLSKKEGPAFRKKFYDLIIQSLEAQPSSSPEDKMLINTALYLKSGDRWKEVIREYWKNKRH